MISNKLPKSFINKLNDANRSPSDVFHTDFTLTSANKGAPLVKQPFTEFSPRLNLQKYNMSDIIAEAPGVVDLDKATTNLEFLQTSIANRVAAENQLSDVGIQLAGQINK